MKLEIIIMAFESLLANKTRSFLSMLGIIIGVSTVIAVFAIGQGAQRAVDEQFQGLSANTILVMGKRGRGATGSSKLKASDVEVVLEKAEYVDRASVSINGNGSASQGTMDGSFSVIGSDPSYFEISNLELESGRAISDDDLKGSDKVAVIGSGVVEDLFEEGERNVGATIVISGKRVEVIGVLKEKGASGGMIKTDDSIIVPYTTAEKSILGGGGMVMMNFQAKSVDEVALATEEITSILRTEHRLKASQEDDFRVMDAGSMVGEAQDAAKLMSLILVAIAAITLLVSGIGIMNVMFVTVAERTKEIGIAKAIGGKQGDILSQFILESVVLSVIGGIMGILFGNGAIYVFRSTALNELVSLAPSVMGVATGFGFSVLVGVFFGFYPALKASKLDPVDALRSE